MTKKLLVVTSLIVVVAIALAGCQSLGDISESGNQFMTALKNQDYAASYALLTPALQQELGGQEGWKTFAEPRNFEDWKFTSNSVENDQGELVGETSLGNEIYDISLVFQNVDNQWKVAGINITFKGNK